MFRGGYEPKSFQSSNPYETTKYETRDEIGLFDDIDDLGDYDAQDMTASNAFEGLQQSDLAVRDTTPEDERKRQAIEKYKANKMTWYAKWMFLLKRGWIARFIVVWIWLATWYHFKQRPTRRFDIYQYKSQRRYFRNFVKHEFKHGRVPTYSAVYKYLESLYPYKRLFLSHRRIRMMWRRSIMKTTWKVCLFYHLWTFVLEKSLRPKMPKTKQFSKDEIYEMALRGEQYVPVAKVPVPTKLRDNITAFLFATMSYIWMYKPTLQRLRFACAGHAFENNVKNLVNLTTYRESRDGTQLKRIGREIEGQKMKEYWLKDVNRIDPDIRITYKETKAEMDHKIKMMKKMELMKQEARTNAFNGMLKQWRTTCPKLPFPDVTTFGDAFLNLAVRRFITAGGMLYSFKIINTYLHPKRDPADDLTFEIMNPFHAKYLEKERLEREAEKAARMR